MIIAAMRYQDPDAAVTWLQEAFGFTEHNVYRDDDGHVGHAELSPRRRHDHGQRTARHGLDRRPAPPTRSRPRSASTSSSTTRARTWTARRRAGAEIVRDLEHMDYGSDEYSARDLEGNLWSFGTYRP